MQLFLERVQKLWNKWELRGMVLLSLFLQIVLILFSNRRKYTATPWVGIMIWLAYLSADWVATISIGILCNAQGDSDFKLLDPNYTVVAFWAPFLLLHLGGPDTITAYSLEDNELWLRHLLGLVVQVGVAFYVFLRSWAPNRLTFLSISMFVAGIIKYGERTWVLRSASKDHFREALLPAPDPGPDYVELTMNDSLRKQDQVRQDKVAPQSNVGNDNTVGNTLMDKAYFLFNIQFRLLFADLILSLDDQKLSSDIIRELLPEEAFHMVEMELSFMYDVLYTKATLIYSRLGLLLRSTSFLSTISASVSFFFIDKHKFSYISINITYALLWGAIFLEIYAFTKLILSDWSVVWFSKKQNFLANSIRRAITYFRSTFFSDQRWSRCMAQYNLIDSCLKDESRYDVVPKCLDVNKFLEQYWYMTWEKVDDMKKPLFNCLKEMIEEVPDPRLLLKHRGDCIISKDGLFEELGWSVAAVEFDHSILLWHIATHLCYTSEVEFTDTSPSPNSWCTISKCLSNYMLYLLVMCPFMLPKGIGEFRLRDTRAEAKRFFQQRDMSIDKRKEALKELLKVNTRVEPQEVKGDRSKSVLFEACKLAEMLRSLRFDGDKWKMISYVWMEMLCYGASHCTWTQHAHQLGRGGELLTHVCLLMSHLGITEQIQILWDPAARIAAAVEAAEKSASAAEHAARRATERAKGAYGDALSQEEADASAAKACAKAQAARAHASAITAYAKATGVI